MRDRVSIETLNGLIFQWLTTPPQQSSTGDSGLDAIRIQELLTMRPAMLIARKPG